MTECKDCDRICSIHSEKVTADATAVGRLWWALGLTVTVILGTWIDSTNTLAEHKTTAQVHIAEIGVNSKFIEKQDKINNQIMNLLQRQEVWQVRIENKIDNHIEMTSE